MRPLGTFHRVLARVLLVEVAVLAAAALWALFLAGTGTFCRVRETKIHQVRGVDLPALHQAFDQYRAKERRLPEDLEEMVAGGYFVREPTDPWGRDYRYQRLDGGACFGSLGKDGSPGGEGEDADLWSGVAASPSEPAPPCGAPP